MSTLDFLKNMAVPQRQIIDIPLDKIRPDPDQPRKSLQAIDGVIDSATQLSLNELAEDIADQGLHQPITVREVEDGTYLIVMGERRWRAFKLNQENGIPHSDMIPSIVRQDLSMARLRLSQLSENLQRSDLTDLEIATFVKAILEQYPDLQKQELAKLLKKNNQWISRILALVDPQWADIIESGIITYASLLEQFRSLPDEKKASLLLLAKEEKRPLTSGDMKKAREDSKQEKKHVNVETPKNISVEVALEKLGLVSDSENKTVDVLNKGTSLESAAELQGTTPSKGLTVEIAGQVQEIIDVLTPKDEHYHPPVSVQYVEENTNQAIVDFGGDGNHIPNALQGVNLGVLEKRETKITLEQLERIFTLDLLSNKEHVVSLVLPVEDFKNAIVMLGGTVPEDDSLTVLTFMKMLNQYH